MTRLSKPLSDLQPRYDVIVVGSGYGGSITASRMARAGRRVGLLERGPERQPGEFPDHELEALREMQIDLPGKHLGRRTGLFDIRVNPDISVVLGCGLGGTSLINANVSLEPRAWVLDEDVWPQALREDRARLAEGFERARDMLKPQPLPAEFDPCKFQQLKKSAGGINGPKEVYRPPINVNFKAGVNHVGVYQDACNGCGDCVSGCNISAKNTTLMNYLPDARNHGADLFTEVAVRYVEREGSGWRVYFESLGGGQAFQSADMSVWAEIVVLGAGSLSSTEILLRSKDKGLSLSSQVGGHFTGNGDFLGFAYNTDDTCNGIGTGTRSVENPADEVGACITGIIDLRGDKNGREPDGMVIEEGVIPGALSALMPAGLATAAALVGIDTDDGFMDTLREQWRRWRSSVPLGGAYKGAIGNTLTYLVMTHDNAQGEMRLEHNRLRIHWPGAGKQPIYEKVNRNLHQATAALGGTYVKNPAWSPLLNHSLVTVHPLGGCVMADDATKGVVNHKGQVFTGPQGEDVYENLYVCDGAIVPRTLGVNPLLTISALTERNCHYMAADRGWTIDYEFGPVASSLTDSQDKAGLMFTERMTGYFSTVPAGPDDEPYEMAYQRGKQDASPFTFILTMVSNDLDTMLADSEHRASLTGTVEAPALSGDPLTVLNGTFQLFVPDPDDSLTKYMKYQMPMIDEDGRAYFFEGHKVVRDTPGFDLWQDTSTLYITVYDGPDRTAPVLGRGRLHIELADFGRQLGTVKVLNVRTFGDRMATRAKFVKYFAGSLLNTYF